MKIEFNSKGEPTPVLSKTEERQLMTAGTILKKIGVIDDLAKRAALACFAYAAGEEPQPVDEE